MNGVSETSGSTASIELKGHLIDSLTLSKVIDRVQQLGGDYRLNDIRIGGLKKDVSSIHMTLMAPDAETLESLKEAILPYGAHPDDGQDAMTAVCQHAGVSSEEAYAVKVPEKVFYGGRWIPVERGGSLALVIQDDKARMIPVTELKQGDMLVIGSHGLQW